MYVAHPDIINFTGDLEVYDKHMIRLVQALKERHMPIEINCGGYRVFRHYPGEHFMELAAKQGCEFIVGIDAHDAVDLVDYKNIRACAEMAKKFGGIVLNE